MSQLDYGIIGNCQASALIDKSGKIAWCCLPRFDSQAVFASILDETRGGYWSIEPAVPRSEGDDSEWRSRWETRQYYMRNTNVLVTLFTESKGGLQQGDQFEVVDFMPRYERQDGVHRPPRIVRVVRPLRGMPRVVIRCNPRIHYGQIEPAVTQLSQEIVYKSQDVTLFLSTDASVSYIMNETPFELKESKHFVLSYGMPFEGPLRFGVEEQLDRTIAYWRTWAKHCNIPFEFQNEVIRSALALKLHIFEDTGAIVAATTTSIPEGPESGRTWDYRYCWLRDAYFVVTALNRMGQFEEMEAFIKYLQNICAAEGSRPLQPVYGISGETELLEQELPWLSGFKGYGPVRIGNAAYKMNQHDVYGEMVLAITPTFFDRRLDRTDQTQALRNVQQLIEQAILCFDQPDAGIWEFRGSKVHSVFSKLMNWAAVDRGVRIAGHIGRHELVNEWAPIRERMRESIERNAWNELVGYYAQSYGGDSPDASNLLLSAVNFISHRDERFQQTIDNYDRILRVKNGVYRYRTPDDFGIPKTTFTVCSFWIHQANHVGLLSEDMDPESGELWGNFPQTYSHVGLINTAMRISQSWDDAF
jgi:GH15 family glucan-1,4-alpha-glucosidase